MSALIVYQQTVDVPCTQIKTSYQVVDALRGDYYVSRMPVVFTSVEKQMDRWFLLCQEGESSTIRPHQFSRVFLRICNSLSLYTFHYFQRHFVRIYPKIPTGHQTLNCIQNPLVNEYERLHFISSTLYMAYVACHFQREGMESLLRQKCAPH